MNNLEAENISRVTRRQFFGQSAGGLGVAALASMMGRDQLMASSATPKALGGAVGAHFAPKAKRVVLLWQGGGPSHVDLFDEKPMLLTRAGQDIPVSIR